MVNAEPEKLALLHNSDHDIIYKPGACYMSLNKETTSHRIVNRTSRMRVEQDIANIDWSPITNLYDPELKAEAFQKTITDIVDKHCPIKLKRKKTTKDTLV